MSMLRTTPLVFKFVKSSSHEYAPNFSPYLRSAPAIAYQSAPRENTKYNGIFNDIFQSKSNVSTYQSSIDLARAESHNRLSKTARRDVCL